MQSVIASSQWGILYENKNYTNNNHDNECDFTKKTKECNLNNKNATCVWNTHKHIKKNCVLILSSLSTIGIYLSVYWFPYFLNMFYLNILNRH